MDPTLGVSFRITLGPAGCSDPNVRVIGGAGGLVGAKAGIPVTERDVRA